MTSLLQLYPNILFILSDDQGPWALGCAGNQEIRTPNLDLLAAEGIRFTNFYCTSPVCSPARASLLTGQIPSQHGVHDWILGGNIENRPNVGDQPIEYLQGKLTYTEILENHGYNCGISGKWHLGHNRKSQKGFTHWYVHAQNGESGYCNVSMIRDGSIVREPGYVTDRITDDALQFLSEQDRSRPFYLSVHYTAPHSPWIHNHPQEVVDSYNDCLFKTCPQLPRHPWAIKNATWADDYKENLKGYFAAVTAMDENIGRILEKLDQMGVRNQTLICFMSDNGFNCGHHGIWGKGNGTFPLNMYDTSIKVPAIFSHPARIPRGRVCDEMVSGYDFMPTLLEYVGINHPDPEGLPGASFFHLLIGKPMKGREHVVVYDEYGPVRMIRTREWKYIHRYPFGPHELYHLAVDPEEQNNLIDHPKLEEQLAVLRAQLENWFIRYADPAADGTREAVAGMGQLTMSGLAGQGRKAHQSLQYRDIAAESNTSRSEGG